MKNVGVVRFLGTNCDRDIWQAAEEVGAKPHWLWYEDNFDCNNFDAVILPGGFSYGDYLRSGALAAKTRVMSSVKDFADSGKPVLGICNGFQILCEVGLLPGVLLKNNGTRFVDKWVDLDLVEGNSFWGGDSINNSNIPVAHGDGRYYVSDDELKRIEDNSQVWLRYRQNPNGSIQDIAGVMNEQKNVAGLMPHPERAMFEWMGSTEGRKFFETLIH